MLEALPCFKGGLLILMPNIERLFILVPNIQSCRQGKCFFCVLVSGTGSAVYLAEWHVKKSDFELKILCFEVPKALKFY